MRILFSRNLASMRFCENKTLEKISEFTIIRLWQYLGYLFDCGYLSESPHRNMSISQYWKKEWLSKQGLLCSPVDAHDYALK